jgi:hypothetical protein
MRDCLWSHRFTRTLIGLSLVSSIPTAAFAGTISDGQAAYDRGDYAEALRLFSSAAAQGDPEGQCDLALLYLTGHGVTKDLAQALHWYRLSAEQGYKESQYAVGFMYENGEGGVAKNPAEALRWYRLAAAQGNDDAAEAVDRLTKGK